MQTSWSDDDSDECIDNENLIGGLMLLLKKFRSLYI